MSVPVSEDLLIKKYAQLLCSNLLDRRANHFYIAWREERHLLADAQNLYKSHTCSTHPSTHCSMVNSEMLT